MPYELIITEKPQAAEKIARALADDKVKKDAKGGVSYYSLTHKGKQIVVGCAVGHLYSIAEKNKAKWTYPVFEVEWVPASDVQKGATFQKKYLTTLKTLAKGAKVFTVACDFDIEGEVIGYNVIKYACKQKDARRMKFSTLTKEDLVKSYENASPTLEWGQVNAGITRHELDWYYGINLSRALTLAVKNTGLFKILSSGRVQGPALKIIVDREKEIMAFKPEPFWEIELNGNLNNSPLSAWHKAGKFQDKALAKAVFEKTKGKDGSVSGVDKRRFETQAPTPFDLTTLQTEAYRSMGIQPKKTLEYAQELYIAGLISYPRTSSQVLPPEIGYKKILSDLKTQEYYRGYADKLLAKQDLKPNNGKKTDPAHPAIYPTGQITKIDGPKARIYDIVVRRFLSTFGDPAVRETGIITIQVNGEDFEARGTRTVIPGWHEFYGPHVKLEEETMPEAKQGDFVKVKEIIVHDKETQPPKRYTPASIIKELESRNLGTKSTRAQIVDNLVQRGYTDDLSLKATALGIRTCDTLEKYSPEILDEELTRHFEELMEGIREDKNAPKKILKEAQDKLTDILGKFKKKEKQIGAELADALKETRDVQSYVGECPICKAGELQVRRGKFGQFIACSKYPDCQATFKIPAGGVKPTKEFCKDCNYPVVLIFRGRRPQKICINDKCPGKTSAALEKETSDIQNGNIEKKCPKCGEALVVRKSIYGQFLGCSKFPKCRHTEKLQNGKQ